MRTRDDISVDKDSGPGKSLSSRLLAIWNKIIGLLKWMAAMSFLTLETAMNVCYFFLSIVFMVFFHLARIIRRRPDPYGFPEIRKRMSDTLTFLKTGNRPKTPRLPWLNQHRGFMGRLWNSHAYILGKWIHRRCRGSLIQFNKEKFYRFDIMTFHSDLPIPSLYDLSGMRAFPEKIAEEYRPVRNQDGIVFFRGKARSDFGNLLESVKKLQCAWASERFIQPMGSRAEWDGFHKALYGFSGQLMYWLMILSELDDSIHSGHIFHRGYVRKFTRHINRFFQTMPETNTVFADLLFLHEAVLKMWLHINALRGPGEASNHRPFLKPPAAGLGKAGPMIALFKHLIIKNPVSVLLMTDLISDARILDLKEIAPGSAEEEASGDKQGEMDDGEVVCGNIAHLFHTDIGDEIIPWLSNYTYSCLMAPYPSPGRTCFGTKTPDSPLRFFENRMTCIGRLFDGVNKKIGTNPRAKANWSRFQIDFYEMLLREWLLKTPINHSPRHPLPQPDGVRLPARVNYSSFSVDASKEEKRTAIDKDMTAGAPFAALAKKHSGDPLIRAGGGRMGWKKRGDLPRDREYALFFSRKENDPFSADIADKRHYFVIHEQKYTDDSCFLERLAQWAVTEDGPGTGGALGALMRPLEQRINAPRSKAKNGVDGLKTLYQKARFYIGLLRVSQTMSPPLVEK